MLKMLNIKKDFDIYKQLANIAQPNQTIMTKEEFTEKASFELLGEPEALINDFVSYWTETSLNGKKMRFQGQKYFDIKRRFSTWKKNSKNWDKNDFSNQPIMQFINQTYKQ